MKKISVLLVLFTSLTFATTIAFNGMEVISNGKGLKVGANAPTFYTTTINFEDMIVGGQKDKIQIIAFVPSLDTGTCRLETIEFNKKVSQMKNVLLTIVSKDTPFAQKRFCRDNSIKNIITVSDYKGDPRALRYGTTITSPIYLEGFFSRVVYIVNTQGKIAYVQVVKEITEQPNYDAIIKALKKIK